MHDTISSDLSGPRTLKKYLWGAIARSLSDIVFVQIQRGWNFEERSLLPYAVLPKSLDSFFFLSSMGPSCKARAEYRSDLSEDTVIERILII